jgi:protoporphyrinogen oxidase
MQQVETLILGAGPTGLGAAWRLHELGNTDWVLLESAATPGGMASSEKDPAGFIWDLGGHVIHSHFPYFDAVLNTVREWQHPRRSGWIWLGGTFVPTPIQRHLGALPDERGSAVVAELAALSNQPANNLYDYFVATFGPTLTNVFFSPFNDKMWAHSAKLIDHAWTSLRSGSGAANIPAPAPTLISENRPDDTSQFPYPRFGTGAMWAEIAARIPAERQRYRTTVAHVDLERRVAHTTSGEEFAFDQCISSIPLRRLLDSMVDDSHLQARAGDLLHSSVHAVGFGYEGKIPPQLVGVSWIYSPEPGTPFYRSTVLSNYSPAIAGPGRWSILHEVGTSAHHPVDTTTVVTRCREAMKDWAVAGAPVSVWHRYLPFGYPVPFLRRDELLHPILCRLEAHGVRSRGRFGGWRYESCNQDHAFMQGVEAVDANMTGSPERTFWAERPQPLASAASV